MTPPCDQTAGNFATFLTGWNLPVTRSGSSSESARCYRSSRPRESTLAGARRTRDQGPWITRGAHCWSGACGGRRDGLDQVADGFFRKVLGNVSLAEHADQFLSI